jgi:hypothetical protein
MANDLRSGLEGAPVVARPMHGNGGDDGPPPPQPDSGRGKKPERPRGEIWDGCPVRPLGQLDGTSFYLDVHGQLRAVVKHDAQSIMALFGHHIPKLCHKFAQWNRDKEGVITSRKENRFDQTTAAMIMLQACAERGLFDPQGAVRGVGAWADDDGRLVYHLGDKMLIAGKEGAPTTHQGRIYPAYPPIPHPMEAAPGAEPAGDLLDLLDTWQWDRPDLDPLIMLGMVGVQMFGGALDWRPAYWITGGAGTGKSALQRLMLHLHGGEKGLVQSTDPTARGIASVLGQSTLPVALDELEPGDEGSSKEKAIIEAARVASSGGRWLRGSSDQKGSSGQFRSTFLFSSILIPGALKSQDRQRILIMGLHPFPADAAAPPMRADTWRAKGAQIKRQIIDRWPTWADRLDAFRVALAEEQVTGRNADNWATTLAMAQMMVSADMPGEDALRGWARKVAAVLAQHRGEAMTDAEECLLHLLSHRYDPFRRGVQFTLAQWIMAAAGSPGAPEELLGDFSQDEFGQDMRRRKANTLLAPLHIKVVSEGGAPAFLWIGRAKVQPLLDVFRDTQWSGGAWTQSLERVPTARKSTNSRTLAGIGARGTEVPLDALPGLQAFPQDRSRADPAPAPGVAMDPEDYA